MGLGRLLHPMARTVFVLSYPLRLATGRRPVPRPAAAAIHYLGDFEESASSRMKNSKLAGGSKTI